MPPMLDKPVAEALAECGVRPGTFTITYADDLQGNVIAFTANSGANIENIECIWRATWSEFVEFPDAELQSAYAAVGQAYYETHFKNQHLESARKRLADSGLLESLPRGEDFTSREDLAAALEQHCGFEPRTILRVNDDAITVWPQTEGAPLASADFEKFSCLLSSLTLVADADGSLKIGFVGNEKYREPEGE